MPLMIFPRIVAMVDSGVTDDLFSGKQYIRGFKIISGFIEPFLMWLHTA